MARGTALWTEALSHLPPGTRTAFHWIPRPWSVALDLAIQAAGLVSVPVTDPSDALKRDARAWAGPGSPEGIEPVALPDWDDPREPVLQDRHGGVLVEGVEISQEQLAGAAESIQKAVEEGSQREIVVLGHAPERWQDRAVLAWATVHGAATLLSDPGSLVGAAVWARPTVFHGNAAELAALRRAVEEEKPPFWDRRKGRLPFGRLRTVLCNEEEDRGFWEERGVHLFVLTRRPRGS